MLGEYDFKLVKYIPFEINLEGQIEIVVEGKCISCSEKFLDMKHFLCIRCLTNRDSFFQNLLKLNFENFLFKNFEKSSDSTVSYIQVLSEFFKSDNLFFSTFENESQLEFFFGGLFKDILSIWKTEENFYKLKVKTSKVFYFKN